MLDACPYLPYWYLDMRIHVVCELHSLNSSLLGQALHWTQPWTWITRVFRYSSDDLMNWKNQGHAYTHPGPFPCPSAKPNAACGEADRPKVIQHPSGVFVLIAKSSPKVTFAVRFFHLVSLELD